MGILDGKVAVVTGGARGIGRGEALLLAREGAVVVVNDVGGNWDGTGKDDRPAQLVVDEIVAAGGKAAANYDDISAWAGAKKLVDQAVETFGDLHVVVNNAGILRDKMLVNMTEEDWDAVIRVHLKGHAAMSHHACVYWRAQGKAGKETYGRIVNTSSEAGLYGNAGQSNYGAAKAAVATLAQVISREMKKYNVTANAIAPRARTRMITETFGDKFMAAPEDTSAFDTFAPENVAPLVVFLASPLAAHISGQCFVVMGGFIQLMQGWTGVNTIDKGARWEPAELGEEMTKLFGDRSTTLDTNLFG